MLTNVFQLAKPNLKHLILLGLTVLIAPVVMSQQLPQYAPHKHLGVATCGNSTCHSVTHPYRQNNIDQNEYQTWLFHDRHAKAYQTLKTKESQRIAQKLGLKDAATADICLDCHADNVPQEKRGNEFYITDGVGCEACHGGAEKYISTHTLMPYNYQRNIDDGMYPTADLHSRTKLCVSCHVGNEKKLATHQIMGAGHPRLGFELNTFNSRQPAHYTVDKDYLQRKNPDNPLLRLLIGAAVKAQTDAANLQGKLIKHPQGHPEMALFDCHSCHHSLNDRRWQQRATTAGLKPGAIRLNDSSFLLLSALTGAFDKSLQAQLISDIKNLHRSSSKSIKALQVSAAKLQRDSKKAEQIFKQRSINRADAKKMWANITSLGIRGEYHDYVAAEQAVMSLEAISEVLQNSNPELPKLVDQLYEITQNDESFSSRRFITALRKMPKQ